MTPDEALDRLDSTYHSPLLAVVRAEVEALRHDIARHVQIAAEQAQEMEELRARLADAEALAIRRVDIQVRLQVELAAARALRDEAIARVRDMYAGDDGQAWKEARKFLERIDAALAGEKSNG